MPMPTGAECVLFAIDADHEASMEASKGHTRMDVVKQSVAVLAAAKRRADGRHMFGLLVLRETAELVFGPTKSLDALQNAVNRVQVSPTPFPTFELGSLVVAARKAAAALVPEAGYPAPKVRVVLLYCRSATIPSWTQHTGMPLAIDCMYMHERPAPGINCPQEVFTFLEENCDSMARTAGHQAYIFECSATNIKKWLMVLVWMLAHPAQRVPQSRLQLTPLTSLPAPYPLPPQAAHPHPRPSPPLPPPPQAQPQPYQGRPVPPVS